METLAKILGWVGNGLFFSRFLVQWWASEKAGRPVAPAVFWWISVVGAACGAVYTGYRGEEVLLLGYLVNGAIAARNLMLYRPGARRVGPLPALLLASAVWGLILWTKLGGADEGAGFGQPTTWLLLSVVGTVVWSSRFVVQWYLSERRGESHFPPVFWVLSLVGNGLQLVYALHRRDAVLIAGYAVGPFVQVRNLVLAARSRGGTGTAEGAGPDPSRREDAGTSQGNGDSAGGGHRS